MSAAPIEPLFLSVNEAAAVLAISRPSIDKLLDNGTIDSRYQGRRRYVSVASLREYADALPREPAP